jgi:hypothetical protein
MATMRNVKVSSNKFNIEEKRNCTQIPEHRSQVGDYPIFFDFLSNSLSHYSSKHRTLYILSYWEHHEINDM